MTLGTCPLHPSRQLADWGEGKSYCGEGGCVWNTNDPVIRSAITDFKKLTATAELMRKEEITHANKDYEYNMKAYRNLLVKTLVDAGYTKPTRVY